MKTRILVFLTAVRTDPKIRLKFYLQLLAAFAICAVVITGIALFYAHFQNQAIAEKETQLNAAIERTVMAEACTYCKSHYADVKNVSVSIATCDEFALAGDTDAQYRKYHVYGYVTMTDLYGDEYKAKFSATVYMEEDQSGFCKEFEMKTLIKDN